MGNLRLSQELLRRADGEELGLSITSVCVMNTTSIRLGTTVSFHGAGIQFRYCDDGITHWGSRLR